MPRKSRIPPRFFALKKDGSAYIIVAWDGDFFDIAYYRRYVHGEDDVTDELTLQSLHKRFTGTRRVLIDALRVAFSGDFREDWDADMVEVMIRSDPRVPKFPGRAYDPREEGHEQLQEDPA